MYDAAALLQRQIVRRNVPLEASRGNILMLINATVMLINATVHWTVTVMTGDTTGGENGICVQSPSTSCRVC